MQLQIGDRTIDTDEEGYLVDPAGWSEAVAEELARRENLRLEPLHWRVIGFMREHLDSRQVAADARRACKIAGMRRPRAWSTG
jgi:TusE/DsrC/DsvC family sulfur relay protein